MRELSPEQESDELELELRTCRSRSNGHLKKCGDPGAVDSVRNGSGRRGAPQDMERCALAPGAILTVVRPLSLSGSQQNQLTAETALAYFYNSLFCDPACINLLGVNGTVPLEKLRSPLQRRGSLILPCRTMPGIEYTLAFAQVAAPSFRSSPACSTGYTAILVYRRASAALGGGRSSGCDCGLLYPGWDGVQGPRLLLCPLFVHGKEPLDRYPFNPVQLQACHHMQEAVTEITKRKVMNCHSLSHPSLVAINLHTLTAGCL